MILEMSRQATYRIGGHEGIIHSDVLGKGTDIEPRTAASNEEDSWSDMYSVMSLSGQLHRIREEDKSA